jgi:hypothetical protein
MTRWHARLAIQSRVFLTLLALGPLPAWAGRTSHLFMDEAQLVTEGDVELEQWVWTEGRIPSQPQRPVTGWVWFGPVVGISSHLELSLPLQLVATPEQAVLDTISLVARYRFFSREKDEGFQPLVRVEYQQPLSQYASPPVLKVLLVTTYGSLTAVQVAANVGVELGLPFLQSSASGSVSVLGTAALGVSIGLGREFRIAAELDGQLPLAGTPHPNLGQLFLGPSLEWARGPIWVTFGMLFGLTNDSNRFLPKVLWGITF